MPRVSSLHSLVDTTRRPGNSQHQLRTSSGFTQQQFLHHKATAPEDLLQLHQTASPSSTNSRYLHHPSPRTTTSPGLASALRGHISTPWLTKDCINQDIDHQASATNAPLSSTVSCYNLTILLLLQSTPTIKIILIFRTCCQQKQQQRL